MCGLLHRSLNPMGKEINLRVLFHCALLVTVLSSKESGRIS